MNRRISLVVAFVVVLGLLMVAGPVLAANGSVSIGEANSRYFFSPKTVYVNVGESVTWTNGSDAEHTVDSDTGSELASGKLAAGATFDHTFGAAGTFAYHCAIHDYMKGRVVVLAAGVTPPATDLASGSVRTADPTWLGIAVLVLAGFGAAALALRRFRQTE